MRATGSLTVREHRPQVYHWSFSKQVRVLINNQTLRKGERCSSSVAGRTVIPRKHHESTSRDGARHHALVLIVVTTSRSARR